MEPISAALTAAAPIKERISVIFCILDVYETLVSMETLRRFLFCLQFHEYSEPNGLYCKIYSNQNHNIRKTLFCLRSRVATQRLHAATHVNSFVTQTRKWNSVHPANHFFSPRASEIFSHTQDEDD